MRGAGTRRHGEHGRAVPEAGPSSRCAPHLSRTALAQAGRCPPRRSRGITRGERGRAGEPLPRYAASASGGTSVRELMRTVLGSRPDGIEATRPAAEAARPGRIRRARPRDRRPITSPSAPSSARTRRRFPRCPGSPVPPARHLPSAAACRSTSSTAAARPSRAPRLARPVRLRARAARTTSTSSTTGCRTSSADHAPRGSQRSQPQPAGTARA